MLERINPNALADYKIRIEIACSTESCKWLNMVTHFKQGADGKLTSKTYFDVIYKNERKIRTFSINLAIEKYNSLK